MAGHRRPAGPPLGIARGFERSRLEDQLIAAAYELTVPLVRRPLPSPSRADRTKHSGGAVEQMHVNRSAGGHTV